MIVNLKSVQPAYLSMQKNMHNNSRVRKQNGIKTRIKSKLNIFYDIFNKAFFVLRCCCLGVVLLSLVCAVRSCFCFSPLCASLCLAAPFFSSFVFSFHCLAWLFPCSSRRAPVASCFLSLPFSLAVSCIVSKVMDQCTLLFKIISNLN